MAAVLSDTDVSRDPALAALLECDRELASIGRRIKRAEGDRLAGRAGRAIPSRLATRRARAAGADDSGRVALADEIAALEALMRRIDRGHPIGNWLFKTAWSYHVAARMLGRHRHARVHALLDAAVRPSGFPLSQPGPHQRRCARTRCWRSPTKWSATACCRRCRSTFRPKRSPRCCASASGRCSIMTTSGSCWIRACLRRRPHRASASRSARRRSSRSAISSS